MSGNFNPGRASSGKLPLYAFFSARTSYEQGRLKHERLDEYLDAIDDLLTSGTDINLAPLDQLRHQWIQFLNTCVEQDLNRACVREFLSVLAKALECPIPIAEALNNQNVDDLIQLRQQVEQGMVDVHIVQWKLIRCLRSEDMVGAQAALTNYLNLCADMVFPVFGKRQSPPNFWAIWKIIWLVSIVSRL